MTSGSVKVIKLNINISNNSEVAALVIKKINTHEIMTVFSVQHTTAWSSCERHMGGVRLR